MQTSLTPRDHSASDLQFALNCGLRFATPEAFFLGSTQTMHSNPLSVADLGFIPLSLPMPGSPVITSKEPVVLESDVREIALLVGPPGTGKSSFAVSNLPRHARINQDKLKTKARCLSEATSELADKRSVVIDATNIDAQVCVPRSHTGTEEPISYGGRLCR
jgi:bifunctional polynucleotide phosphatase/kinase